MKKFLKNSAIFIILSIPLYIITLCFWCDLMPNNLKQNVVYYNESYGHTYTRLQDAYNFKNIDILFIGSSHVYNGFNPEVFKKMD